MKAKTKEKQKTESRNPMWFANGKKRAQVASDAQDDAIGIGCHAGRRRTKLRLAAAFGHEGYTGFRLDA